MPRLSSKGEFRRLRARLQAASSRDFEDAALPLLRLIAETMVPTPALGSFDQIGADMVAWKADGDLQLVVQCKGFKAREGKLGRSQISQCVKSIRSFAGSGRRTNRYLLVYNRSGKNEGFRSAVRSELESLEASGIAKSAALWGCDKLIAEASSHLISRLLKALSSATRHLCAGEGPVGELCDVPLRTLEMVVDRYQLKESRNEQSTVADPAKEITAIGSGLDARLVLLGEAGFGKTTAALRGAVSSTRHVFVLRAAMLTENPANGKAIVEKFAFVDELLDEVPTDDIPTIAPLARAALDRLFCTSSTPAILVIDGLDESITLTRRGGLQWLFNSLRTYEIPVVFVARTEFWNVRLADFATSFGSVAQKIGTAQRDLSLSVIELLPWSSAEIQELAVRFAGTLDDRLKKANVETFIETVRSGEYSSVYGDIPKRPLFLRMLLETVAQGGVHRTGRVQLLEEWVTQKILRDYFEPMHHGGKGRMPITTSEEPVISTLRLARLAMMRAAMLMTQRQEDHLELLPACRTEQILATEPTLRGIQDPVGLFLNSLLVPLERTDGESVRFGHQTYQEFFLAKYIQAHPEEFTTVTLPAQVREWLADMARTA